MAATPGIQTNHAPHGLEEYQVNASALPYAAEMLANPHLTGLDFEPHCISEDYHVTDSKIRPLTDALLNNTTLKRLNLRLTGISDDAATRLSNVLANNSALTELDVSYNDISSTAGAEIAKGLAQNSSLTTLCLAGCMHNSHSATQFALALRTNTTLKRLDLSGGHRFCIAQGLGDEGAAMIALELRINQGIERLNLSHNFITDSGADHLLRMLAVNPRIFELKLEGSSISDEKKLAIQTEMQRRVERKVFESYTLEEKNRVYNQIWELSGTPMGDPQFGEHNVYQVPREIFIQAIANAGLDLQAGIERLLAN